MIPLDGWRRVVIADIQPAIDGGRYPIKRVLGEAVEVEADLLADGHDAVVGVLRYREAGDEAWREVALEPLGNDRWRAAFVVTTLGRACYTICAWVDRFVTWRRDLGKRVDAGQDVTTELLVGADLIAAASARADGDDAAWLRRTAASLRAGAANDAAGGVALARSAALADRMARWPDRRFATTDDREFGVVVDRPLARAGAWYELFPRSASPEPGRHGTFADVERRLPAIAEMGFDVLYLPPIHPIGRTNRKGRNNAVVAGPGDPGSPWAIGGPEGGHDAVHPQLGALDDFDHLLAAARDHGLELALDLAFQATPDHPWVNEHPRWFRHRPDGSIRFAENPPKQYQDIYPLDFETDDWRALWEELARVVRFWVARGVRVFRVDNPHTKPFPFWEWLIGEVKGAHPDVIFLAEAFTRPKVMQQLAKLGFSQSYTYFAWRNTKQELTRYFAELTQTEQREYLRPNLWPNTPDILTEYLQHGGRSAFLARLTLAATLGASYGVYGPAFELGEALPREPGSEEYLDSEKYEIRHWATDRPDSLRAFIARVNRIRRENPALQHDAGLRFHPIDNDQLIAYSKRSPDGVSVILVVVNLDPHHAHAGWLELSSADLAIPDEQPFQAHDLLTDARYLWHGARAYVQLDPAVVPAHIFRLRRRLRTERDFDYFM
jgi:starch synthase (maltosyl-transferring)